MKKCKIQSSQREEKERLMEQAAKVKNQGICYMRRISHHMDHLRQLLSQYGEIDRIYLAPEDGLDLRTNVVERVTTGGNMLNGEWIGWRKRLLWVREQIQVQ